MRLDRKIPIWAIVFWIALIASVCIRLAYATPGSGTVVPIYVGAAERWQNAEDIYAPQLPLDVYRNPPVVAMAFVPFTRIPVKTGEILWRLIGVALFLGGLDGFVRNAIGELSSLRMGVIYTIAAELIIPSVNNGQINVHLIGAILLGATNVLKDRPWRAALWLGLAASLKLYPVAAAFLFVIVDPRLSWRLLLGVVAMAALPFLGHDPHFVVSEYREFWQFLDLDDRSQTPFLHRAPIDWTIAPRVWFDTFIPSMLGKVIAAIVGLGMAACVGFAKFRRSRTDAVVLALGLGAVWMTAFGPATELPTYALLAPSMAIAAATASFRNRPIIGTLYWIAYLLIFGAIIRGSFPANEIYPCRTLAPSGAILFGIVLIWEFANCDSARQNGNA